MKHIQKLLPFFCFPSLLLTSCFSKAPQPDSSTSESEQASSELDSSGHEHSSSEGGHPTSGEPSSFENSSSMGPSSENSSLPSFGEARFEGTESLSWPLNHYFDPFDGVKAYDGNGEEVTSSLVVDGHVDFSKEGLYRLTYRYGDSFAEREVRISKTAPPPSPLPKIAGTSFLLLAKPPFAKARQAISPILISPLRIVLLP